MRNFAHMIGEPVLIKRLHRRADALMQGPAAFGQDRVVGDFLGKRMLERVLGVRK